LLVVALAAVVAVGAARSATTLRRPATFSLTRYQAEEVSALVRFLDAFNTRRLQDALATLHPSARIGDCDYRSVSAVNVQGRREIARWLRQRFADHDRLIASRIAAENPGQPEGVVLVEYARRTSDTLRALGFPNGIEPRAATKVVFTQAQPPRILAFGNGPGAGPPEPLCRP
jgi:hypothetical protein